MTPELLDLAVMLLNSPGQPGFAPLRLFAGIVLILTVVSGAALFTYWISKDE